jgi:hypothetical protein
MDLPEATRPGGRPDIDQSAPEQVVPLHEAEKVVLYGVPTAPLGGEPEITGGPASALPKNNPVKMQARIRQTDRNLIVEVILRL